MKTIQKDKFNILNSFSLEMRIKNSEDLVNHIETDLNQILNKVDD